MLKRELLNRAIKLVGTPELEPGVASRSAPTSGPTSGATGMFENETIEEMIERTQFPIGLISIYSHHIENRGFDEMKECAIEYYISIKMHVNNYNSVEDIPEDEFVRMFTEPIRIVDSNVQKYIDEYEGTTSMNTRDRIVTYILRDSKVEILQILADELLP